MARNDGQQCGFSLIELLIATTIIAGVIMMSSNAFTILLSQSGQQTKVVSSEMESIIGLRVLRYDIEHAGYGLPERFQNPALIAYSEAVTAPASTYNDSPAGVPRGIVSGDNVGLNGSDYLVAKSTIVGSTIPLKGNTAQQWTYIVRGGNPKTWDSAKLNLAAGSRVVVVKPKSDENSQNELVMNGATFFTQYNASFPSAFSPQKTAERFVIYGVDPDTNLRMPFNRADYYISRLPASNMSPSCAPNTGILYKTTVNQSDGQLSAMPILDCVADMQVVFRRDTDSDGAADTSSNNISTLTAQQIRDTLKEVRVYILAQEGQRDPSYTFTPATITVGDFGLGSSFNLSTTIGTGWQNYRWKVYTLVVTPKQLR
jgi:prepilin-type N-terminal cleavage/methylation domain-containing protein